MQNTYQNQNSIYEKVRNYLAGALATALIFVTPNIAMGKTSEKYAPVKKEGITAVDKGKSAKGIGNVIGGYFEKADSYLTLDELSRQKKLNLGTGLEYTTLIPGCYVLGVAKPVKGLVADAPAEAWKRAKEIKRREHDPNAKKGPIEGVVELLGDVTRPVTQYAVVVVEGTGKYILEGLEYIVKNPGDFSVKTGTAILIGNAWSDAAHRTEHHGGVGEDAPPDFPEFK